MKNSLKLSILSFFTLIADNYSMPYIVKVRRTSSEISGKILTGALDIHSFLKKTAKIMGCNIYGELTVNTHQELVTRVKI